MFQPERLSPSLYSIDDLASSPDRSSPSCLTPTCRYRNLRQCNHNGRLSIIPLDTPGLYDNSDILTSTEHTINQDELRGKSVESPLSTLDNTILSLESKQKSLTPVKSIGQSNSDFRKRRYSDDNETLRAVKLAHSTNEKSVPHHLKKNKSCNHIFVGCSDSVYSCLLIE